MTIGEERAAIEAEHDSQPSPGPVAGGGAPEDEGRRTPMRPRALLALVAALAIVGAVLAAVIPSSSHPRLPGNANAASSGQFAGLVFTPLRSAPALALRNYRGDPVNLARYRGKPVFLTFLYANCPDVCPLIAANLHNALVRLGPQSSRVQIVAVSVDPRGDTPQAVARFVSLHALTGRMKYLIGSARQLGRVWRAWNVGSQRDAGNPELVAHSALVYGISASGKLVTIYPANFRPENIVADLPKLASL
jgi:protein SCO1/2